MADHAVVAGVLETGRQFGLVHLRRTREAGQTRLEIEVEWVVERSLDPGERLGLEDAWLATGADANCLLEDFATLPVGTIHSFCQTLLGRYPVIELAGDPLRQPSNLNNSLKKLPVRF